jgi:nucleotide-binding universal stress UspA family protein
MSYQPRSQYQIALEDFRRARRQAATHEILRKLRGQPLNLLPFDTIQKHLSSTEISEHGLQRIPIKSIVGSVGRYTDFTRDFLPRSGALQNRWARIKSTFRNLEEMPPIRVYQIGEAYFVLDGNHRVSIAREKGADDIRAYVTELHSSIHITPETDLDKLILEIETKEFLTLTQLDNIKPLPELTVTIPGKYAFIIQQINGLLSQINQNRPRKTSFSQAAKDWYRYIYQPAVQIIQTHDLLRDFPNRTETDLYIWISQHQEELRESLGWGIDPKDAAIDLAEQFSSRPQKIVARWGERILEHLRPAPIDPGPKAGYWRKQQVSADRREQLFSHILVALSGEPQSWQALEQASLLAHLESANLLGLHIVSNKKDASSSAAKKVQTKFNTHCEQADIPGDFAIDIGEITPTIVSRARWSDLVVVHLAHPPHQKGIRNIAPGFHRLVQRCPQPIMVVPKAMPSLHRLLLAYDGSPKSNEALFISAYLAGKWGLPLTILIVLTGGRYPKKAVARARWYLNTHRVIGDVHLGYGEPADVILETAQKGKFDLTLMGGYSTSPMLEIIIGSTLNKVLQNTKRPILICR